MIILLGPGHRRRRAGARARGGLTSTTTWTPPSESRVPATARTGCRRSLSQRLAARATVPPGRQLEVTVLLRYLKYRLGADSEPVTGSQSDQFFPEQKSFGSADGSVTAGRPKAGRPEAARGRLHTGPRRGGVQNAAKPLGRRASQGRGGTQCAAWGTVACSTGAEPWSRTGPGIGAGHARNSQQRTACGRAYQAGPSQALKARGAGQGKLVRRREKQARREGDTCSGQTDEGGAYQA